MKAKVLTNIDDLDITKETWNALVLENETNTIFQTFDWFQCWWSAYGKDYSPFIILVYADDNELLGFAPLAINRSSSGKQYLTFIGDGKADYLDFIVPRRKKEVLYQILLAIKQNKSRWTSIVLRNIPACSSTTGLIKYFQRTGFIYGLVDRVIPCPTLIVRNRKSEAQHIANKYSIKRPYNYFKRSGSLNHKILRDSQEIEKHIESFFQQHISRWDNTTTPSLFLFDNNTIFYRLLSSMLLNNNQLLFSLVEYNGQPLAYHFGFDYNGVVTWYKPSFDIKFAKHSPGTLMARYLINYCLDNDRKEFDFTIGNEPFKNRFTNMTRLNNNFRIFTNQFTYYLCLSKVVIKSIVKKIIGKQ